MSGRSNSLQVGSAQQKSPGIRKSIPSNRKCVVVGQKMVKTEETVAAEAESDSGSPTQVEVTSERQSIEDLPNRSFSESMRSSGSSFLGSSYGGFDESVGTSENKLLDELEADVEATAVQLVKLELEVESIPILKKNLDVAEKEKKLISEELSEKCEIVETMKQRLSVLHEQNSQLAQLTQNSSDSSEATLRMRNALVASLAQLKKLQSRVDEIPGLKTQITTLEQENLQLKEQEQVVLEKFSVNLPEGATPLDYDSLQEESEKLKKSNESLNNEVLKLTKSMEVLSESLEDTRKRIGNFEQSTSSSIPSSNYIKKLEKEKEDLYDELIQLKLDRSISQSIDTVYLDNECASLRKVNGLLQKRLDDLSFQYKQQKEKIVTKLFEIELSNLKSRKFEVEKHLSDLDVHKSATHGVTVPGEDDSWTTLPPQFKAQILKLHQFRLQNEQSHQVMQLILSEKEELEKDLTELKAKLEAKSIAELEGKIKGYENKIAISRAKITDLEKRLSFSSQAVGTDHSALVSENFMLKSQLSQSSGENHAVAVAELKKQLLEEQRSHETRVQKYKKLKDQNQKLETKLKENKNRYQGLASELSNCVQLMKKYQIQCMDFEKEVEVVSAEREAFRKEASSLKAELEVIKAEYVQHDGLKKEPDSTMDDNQKLLEENSALKETTEELKERMHEQNLEAERRLESTTHELKRLTDQLLAVNESLALQQQSLQEANMKIDQLKVERTNLLKLQEHELSLKNMLLQRNQELSDEKTALSSELKESVCTGMELNSRLTAMEDECRGYISHLDDSESKLTGLLKEAEDCKFQNSELLASVSAKDEIIRDLTRDLTRKEKEFATCKEELSSLQLAKAEVVDDSKCVQLHAEIEGYKAMMKSLQRQLDEAETREIEHEILKQKIQLLERSLGDSSHDNKALLKLLHETVQEIPSLSQAEQSLQDKNLQLEEQVSVLSQWNDKQRQEIEQLERTVEESAKAFAELVMNVNRKDEISEENVQLKRELKEVEIEVNSLRRQVQADVQEELQVKLEAKTQLLEVFNQHNTQLQRQVEELQIQVKHLGGKLEREKAASPPPMPDIALSLAMANAEDHVHRSKPSLEKECIILRQRLNLTEKEVMKLHAISADVRRCGSLLHALSTISVGSATEEVLVTVPREMLLSCSLLADHLNLNASLEDSAAQSWIHTIHTEWFACVSQRFLTPACAQCYIATLSQLSHKLLDVVINLQDSKGNTALHHTASNGNIPALSQFINLRSCDPCIMNEGGYNALMLLSACVEVDVTVHSGIMNILIERTGVNTGAKTNQRTALMLAASAGNCGLVNLLFQSGCSVNQKDKDGSTALMFAAQRGNEDIVKILLAHSNCDAQIKDNDGQTAKEIARLCGHSSIFALLKKLKP